MIDATLFPASSGSVSSYSRRLSAPPPPRLSSIRPASFSTVGLEMMSITATATSSPTIFLTRETAFVASNESPPRSKKSATTLGISMSSRSA